MNNYIIDIYICIFIYLYNIYNFIYYRYFNIKYYCIDETYITNYVL